MTGSFSRTQFVNTFVVSSNTTTGGHVLYNPDTYRFQGTSPSFLIEPKSKNLLRNPNLLGTTVPTNWSITSIPGSSRSFQRFSVGEKNVLKVDYTGTVTETTLVETIFDITPIVSAPGTVYNISSEFAMNGNFVYPCRFAIDFLNIFGEVIETSQSDTFTVDVNLRLFNYNFIHTNSNACFIRPKIVYTVPINAILSQSFFYGAPMLKPGAEICNFIGSSDTENFSERLSENYEIPLSEANILKEQNRGTILAKTDFSNTNPGLPKAFLTLKNDNNNRITFYRKTNDSNVVIGVFTTNTNYTEHETNVSLLANSSWGVSWGSGTVTFVTNNQSHSLRTNPSQNISRISLGDEDSYIPLIDSGFVNPGFLFSRTGNGAIWHFSGNTFIPVSGSMQTHTNFGLEISREIRNYNTNPLFIPSSGPSSLPIGMSRTRNATINDVYSYTNLGMVPVLNITITGNTGASPSAEIIDFFPRSSAIDTGLLTGSFYYRIAANTTGNSTLFLNSSVFSNRMVAQATNGSMVFTQANTINTPNISWQRAVTSWNVNTGTGGNHGLQISNIPPNLNNINLTLQFALPQLQRNNGFATNVVTPTSASQIASSIKGADVYSGTLNSLGIPMTTGTYVFSVVIPFGMGLPVTENKVLIQIDDGTNNNLFTVVNIAGATSSMHSRKITSGVLDQKEFQGITNGSVIKGAFSIYSDNSISVAINNMLQTHPASNFGSPLTVLRLSSSGSQLNGFYQNLYFLPRTFSNDVLLEMSKPMFQMIPDNSIQGTYRKMSAIDNYHTPRTIQQALQLF